MTAGFPKRTLAMTLMVMAGGLFLAQVVWGDSYDDVKKEIEKGLKAFGDNRPEEALKSLGQVMEMVRNFKPDDRFFIRQALMASNSRKASEAIKALEMALERNPKSAEAYALRGYVYMNLVGNLPLAREDLIKSLELKKVSSQPVDKSWFLHATSDLWNLHHLGNRDYEQAASDFQHLVDLEPKNAKYLYYLGRAHSNRNSFDQAVAALGKGLDCRPDDWQIHLDFAYASRKASGLKGTIQSYEELLQKHPAELAVLIGLAKLYLEDDRENGALELLQKIKGHKSLLAVNETTINSLDLLSIRIELAQAFAKAQKHDEAADQFARVLGSLPNNWSPVGKINHTLDYGKSLVRAGKLDEGIKILNKALMDNRSLLNPPPQQLLYILFELGNAHRLAKRRNNAELYFREYLKLLQEGTVTTVRWIDDVKTAEDLGDLYLDEGEYRKAGEVFQQAIEIIKVLKEDDRMKYPRNRVQYHLAKALHGQGEWEKCIPAAKELVDDKEYGLKAKRILAAAYLEMGQTDKALDYLGQIKNTAQWDPDSMTLMARAFLAANRRDEALKQIELALEKKAGDEQFTLLYAQVLGLLDREEEAAGLYKKVLKDNPRSYQAWVGLGDLEMHLAKGSDGRERLEHLTQAVSHFKEGRNLRGSDTGILSKLGHAQQEQARAEADLQARSDRLRLVLYTGGLILAALIPIGFMIYFYRRHWAMRCFKEVCNLERDLIQLIRDRVQWRWGGAWERLGEEPFRGRLDFKSLRHRAEKDGARDILGVANFGHLVAIVDAGWEVLGFNELCAPEMVDPREVIIANLSYIGSCRVCLAHVGKLEELTARHIGRNNLGSLSDGSLKGHLSKHLHRQVRTSLQIIRAKFRLTVEAVELPILAPVARGPEYITRTKPDDPRRIP